MSVIATTTACVSGGPIVVAMQFSVCRGLDEMIVDGDQESQVIFKTWQTVRNQTTNLYSSALKHYASNTKSNLEGVSELECRDLGIKPLDK